MRLKTFPLRITEEVHETIRRAAHDADEPIYLYILNAVNERMNDEKGRQAMINKSMGEYLKMTPGELSDELSEMTKGDCFELIKRLLVQLKSQSIIIHELKEVADDSESRLRVIVKDVARIINKHGFQYMHKSENLYRKDDKKMVKCKHGIKCNIVTYDICCLCCEKLSYCTGVCEFAKESGCIKGKDDD